MAPKNPQVIFMTMLGLLVVLLVGAVSVLFLQQQALQKALTESGGTAPQSSEAPKPLAPPFAGPVYGDIAFRGELKEDGTFVFREWGQDSEIRRAAVFASEEPEGGALVFEIASDDTALPKPYTLGTVPPGFTLEGGSAFTALEAGKYRVEITALQGVQEIKVLHYLYVGDVEATPS